MTNHEIFDSAAALYDGGWRKEDKEDMMTEYGLTDEEAEKICEELAVIEIRALKSSLTITNDAHPEYRSDDINPNNWYCSDAIDGNGVEYRLWWYVDGSTDIDTQRIDWSTPDDVTASETI